jgi:hypothetical protein
MGQMMKQPIILFIPIILFFSSLIMVLQISTPIYAQAQDPTVSITLEQPHQTADVSPDGDGKVEFDGYVSVYFDFSTTVIVSLTVTDTWKSAQVTPSTIQFSERDYIDKLFRVQVQVPKGSSSNTVGEVVVKGKWTIYPEDKSGDCYPINGVKGKIDVNQYYDFNYNVKNLFTETDIGERAAFTLDIQNTGNYNETFTFSIDNLEELEGKDFNVKLSTDRIMIPMNDERTITIFVEPPDDNRWKGDYYIFLKVTPEEAAKYGYKSRIMELNLKLNPKTEDTGLQTFLISVILIVFIILIILLHLRWYKSKKTQNKPPPNP